MSVNNYKQGHATLLWAHFTYYFSYAEVFIMVTFNVNIVIRNEGTREHETLKKKKQGAIVAVCCPCSAINY